MSAETVTAPKRPAEGNEENHAVEPVPLKKQKSIDRDEVRALTENEKSEFR
jgi:hypothetical protein